MNLASGPATARFGVAAVFFCLYAACSAWIIRGEGEAYRKTLRDKHLVARADVPPAPPEVRADVAPDPPPRRERPATVDEPASPEVRPTPPPPAPALPAEPRPILAPEADPPVVPEPKLDPFWEQPEQRRVWKLDPPTVEEERRLGADLNRMILKHHKRLEVGPLPRRLEDAAEPYLAARSRKEIPYTFTVLDCDESNVFSHPGGYVYACRGLFDWISEEEDYMLEFALAHEIAHVDLKHALDFLRDPEVRRQGLGTVTLFYTLGIPLGYSPEQDRAADQWAARQMIKAGRSPYKIKAFLYKLEDYARTHGFENFRKGPRDEPRLTPLDNHIRAHPIPRDRIKELKVQLDPTAKPR